MSGAAVKKTESAPGTGAEGVYSSATGARRRVQRLKEHRAGRHSSGFDAPMEGRRTAGVCQQPGGAKGEGCSVIRESHYETYWRHPCRVEVGVSPWQVLQHAGTGIRADYVASALRVRTVLDRDEPHRKLRRPQRAAGSSPTFVGESERPSGTTRFQGNREGN